MANQKAKAKRKSVVPENETKEARFLRLAIPRMNRVLKAIHSVGQLSSKSSYGYTLEQVDQMATAVEQAVITAFGRFRSAPDQKSAFTLK